MFLVLCTSPNLPTNRLCSNQICRKIWVYQQCTIDKQYSYSESVIISKLFGAQHPSESPMATSLFLRFFDTALFSGRIYLPNIDICLYSGHFLYKIVTNCCMTHNYYVLDVFGGCLRSKNKLLTNRLPWLICAGHVPPSRQFFRIRFFAISISNVWERGGYNVDVGVAEMRIKTRVWRITVWLIFVDISGSCK